MEQDGQGMRNVTLCHARKSLSFELFAWINLQRYERQPLLVRHGRQTVISLFLVFLSYTFLCPSEKTH